MKRKLSANFAQIDSPGIPGTGLVDLALSALYAGGFVFLFAGSLSITVYAIWEVSPLTLLLADIVLSLAAAGGLGFWRMLACERDDRVNRTELQRRRLFEDADWNMAADVHTDVRLGREPNASRTDEVARKLMRRYYASKSISRKACVNDSICSHAEWNKVNALLQTRGIRAGRLLVPDNYPAALEAWYKGEDTTRRFSFVDREMVAAE